MGKPGVFKKINDQDKSITPYKVYKSWRYTSTSSLDSSGIDRLVATKPNPLTYSGGRVTLDTWQTAYDSSSLFINSANDKEASLVWYSINHLYYKRAGRPFETFGYADPAVIERTVFDEASVISIPQKQFGESIKPGTVKLHLQNSQLNSNSMSLYDDGKGNLIDSALSSSISNEILYLGFNAMTYSEFWTDSAASVWGINSNNISSKIQTDTTIQDLDVIGKNIYIANSEQIYNLFGKYTTHPYGNSAMFNNTSYIRIPNNDSLNFKRSEDFAIGMWIGHDNTPSANNLVTVLSKRTTGKDTVVTKKGKPNYIDVNWPISQYPYDIRVISGSTIECRQSDGANITTITGSLLPNNLNHILLQKTGSKFELYLNSTLVQSKTIEDKNYHNKADIFIGSAGLNNNGTVNNGFVGCIDEFMMFKKALTANEITQLSYTGSQNLMTSNTNAVGNVFYEHGLIIISDPRPKYGTAQYRMFDDKLFNYKTGVNRTGYLSNFLLEYNSTVTLYEHEYICKANEDEFNFTSNPTIRTDNDMNSEIPKAFVFNEKFTPYITTIGLYDKYGRLLAIGKLGTPIRKRNDVELNLIVKFDM
jgi:hypothetical protein